MSAKPGADERRIRSILQQRGVGPDAIPPKPTIRPRDWLDDILDSPAPAPAVRAPEPPRPAALAARPVEKTPPPRAPEPQQPAVPPAHRVPTPRQTRTAAPIGFDRGPRQSLLDAFDRTSPRTRWLAHHATAAAAGWPLGITSWATDTAAWYAAGNWTAPSAWVLYGLGLCTLALYRRSRTWAWPVAWAAAIPTSSVVVGLLLYGTGA
ncbi:hypothetical protein ABTX71_12970 [Streptomyces parvulus]|uniref:hypothetical protein n=1 Tax=Streptomyces parvulus TaxID=146923 RepID=UPI003324D593